MEGTKDKVLQKKNTTTLDADKTVSTTVEFWGQPNDSGNSGNSSNSGSGGDQYAEETTPEQGTQSATPESDGSTTADEGSTANDNSDEARESAVAVLPDTGGASLSAFFAFGAGALLVAGGLIVRRVFR